MSGEDEELYGQFVELIKQEGRASVSLFQRRFRLGYSRASRITQALEIRGVIGKQIGAKPREILIENTKGP